MKAYIITIKDHYLSEQAAEICRISSLKMDNDFTIETYDAITPANLREHTAKHLIHWTWPWQGETWDLSTGLKKKAYNTRNPDARFACAMSHYLLWRDCVLLKEPILILEHDAFFIKKFDPRFILESNYDIVGINDPRGATPKSLQYHNSVQATDSKIAKVPWVNEITIPQGLPGNSAYFLKPAGASKLLAAVRKYGMWPNDALMCKQLFSNLGVSKEYYTTLQKLGVSTTAD